MGVSCGFYDSKDGDRRYTVEQVSQMFDGFFSDGVFPYYGNKFGVTPGEGLRVSVDSGKAWFNGTWTVNDDILDFGLDEADPTYDRIDAVVLEVDKRAEGRANSIKVIKGVAAENPTRPSIDPRKNLLRIDIETLKRLNTVGRWEDNQYIIDESGIVLTFTVNEDSSITVNGQTWSPTFSNLLLMTEMDDSWEGLMLSGCPSDGGGIGASIRCSGHTTSAVYAEDTGSGSLITRTNNRLVQDADLRIEIPGWRTVSDLTFYPMIRNPLIEDDTYEPYVEDVYIYRYAIAYVKVRAGGTSIVDDDISIMVGSERTPLSKNVVNYSDGIVQSVLKRITAEYKLNIVYPVGSIFITTSGVNPSSFIGGVWEQIKGRFLIGAGSLQDAKGNTVTLQAGTNGGEYDHLLISDEMAEHTHTGSIVEAGAHSHGYKDKYMQEFFTKYYEALGPAGTYTFLYYDRYTPYRPSETKSFNNFEHVHEVTGLAYAGESQPHNNMPPYLVVYMWKRVA